MHIYHVLLIDEYIRFVIYYLLFYIRKSEKENKRQKTVKENQWKVKGI